MSFSIKFLCNTTHNYALNYIKNIVTDNVNYYNPNGVTFDFIPGNSVSGRDWYNIYHNGLIYVTTIGFISSNEGVSFSFNIE